MKKTKYCQRIGTKGSRHLRDKKSPSSSYCTECYLEMKERYDNWDIGLRGVRELSSTNPKIALAGFFAYVMPHISIDKANEYIRELTTK